VINHERFDLSFRWFESEAEPFWKRRENRVWRVGCRGAAIGVTSPKRAKYGPLSRKFHAQIESAGHSGLVDDRAAYHSEEHSGKVIECRTLSFY
jgi:hypothetical protein